VDYTSVEKALFKYNGDKVFVELANEVFTQLQSEQPVEKQEPQVHPLQMARKRALRKESR
jgi:hypothetical protein